MWSLFEVNNKDFECISKLTKVAIPEFEEVNTSWALRASFPNKPKVFLHSLKSQANSNSRHASKIEEFVKIFDSFNSLKPFTETSILDVWWGPESASGSIRFCFLGGIHTQTATLNVNMTLGRGEGVCCLDVTCVSKWYFFKICDQFSYLVTLFVLHVKHQFTTHSRQNASKTVAIIVNNHWIKVHHCWNNSKNGYMYIYVGLNILAYMTCSPQDTACP